MRRRVKLIGFLGIFTIVFLFIFLSYLIQTRLSFFEDFIINGWTGMVAYVFLKILSTVFAPVSALPFITLAVGLWGVFVAVFLSVLGWTIGGVVAFLLARKFGVLIIKKFISLEDIYAFEEKFSFGNNFWSILLLRMIVPVDVLSYGLGLFSKVNFWTYTFATFIGVIPFAIIFSYFGEIPYVYQMILGLLFLIGVLGWMILKEIRARH